MVRRIVGLKCNKFHQQLCAQQETSSYHLPRCEAGILIHVLYSTLMTLPWIRRILFAVLGLSGLLPLGLLAEESAPIQVDFETSQGLVTCTLVSNDEGQADLVDCVFEDGSPLTEEQIVDLGLKSEKAETPTE